MNTREKKFFVPYIYHANNNINIRWYVFWFEPVPGTNLRKRKKCHGQINYCKTVPERMERAREVIEYLRANNFFYQNRAQPETFTALHKILNERYLRKHGKRFYKTHLRVFLKWWGRCPLQCRPADAKKFLRWLLEVKEDSTTTVNHYRNSLKSLYAEAVKLKKISINPFAEIKKLPETRTSKRAFTPAQVKEIKQYLLKHNPDLWRACEFIYYCFIRPNELRQLKIENIDFYNNTITVPGAISKNKKTQTVVIPAAFVPSVAPLAKRPEYYYIIGNGTEPVGETFLAEHFRYVLNVLQYDKRYSLYSFKHTGAMFYARATKDIKGLQLQLRHHSLDMVNEYLKNFGVMENDTVRAQFPAI